MRILVLKFSKFRKPKAFRLMTLMWHLKELVDQNSQFIISTHPPILLTFPEAEVTGLEHNCSVTELGGFF